MAESSQTNPRNDAIARRLAPRGRSTTYSTLVGLALGSLLMGVLVPFAVGDAPGETLVQSDGVALQGDPATPGGQPPALQADPGAAPGDATGGASAAPPGAAPGSGFGDPGAAGLPGSASSAGSGSGSAPGAPSGGGPAAPGPAKPLTASDRGVTATSVKIGMIIPDLGSLGDFGFGVNAPDVQGKYQAVVDQVNETGGLNGRKIVPVFRKVDVVDQNKMRQACLAFANDDKVFSVVAIGGFYGPAVRCLTIDTRTPFVNFTPSFTSDYRAAGGYLVSLRQDNVRDSANLADRLNGAGLLKGRKIGILNASGFTEASRQGFKAVAKQLGGTVVSEYTLSGDVQQASGQIPVAVNQFQRDGVDTVVLAVNFIYGTQFVQTAENQGARFRYHASDDQGASTDAWLQNMPASFDGTIGISSLQNGEARVGIPEHTADRQCVANYLKRPYAKKFDPKDRTSSDYGATGLTCGVLQVTAAAARAAGPDLTRARFVAAVQTLGTMDLPTLSGPATFSRGKVNGGDHHHLVQADMSCKCWKPVRRAAATRDRY
jgi:hypothetical protein